MTRDKKNHTEADDRFIETLLHEAYDDDDGRNEQRVRDLMQRIGTDATDNAPATSLREETRPGSKRRPWIQMAVAAAILLIVGYSFFSDVGSNQAYAAVMRAIEAALPTRQYRIAMVNRWPIVGTREVTATLYVNDQDQFCLRHPGWLPGGELWVGGDLNSRWIVPRLGPVITGDEDLIGSVLRPQGLDSPMLHMKTLLTRMTQDYDLELLSNGRINSPRGDGESIECDHVVGTRRSRDGRQPIKIELWANQETGAAERVLLHWPDDDESLLPVQWEIDLVAFPELADDWFDYQGHADADRLVLPMN